MAKNVKDYFKASSNTLVNLLRESNDKVKQLQEEVAQLKRELSKYKTQNAKMRQRVKSLTGRLKAEQLKVTSLQRSLKVQKIKTKKATKAQKSAETETIKLKTAIKNITPKLTKDQVFELYRSSNFQRFWERVQQVLSISPDKLLEMQQKMSSWASQQLRDIVRIAGWRSTWYDSDAEWNSSELAGWDERNLYAFIMSY